MSENTPNNWTTDKEQAILDEIAKPNSRVTFSEDGEEIKQSYPVPLENNKKKVMLPIYTIDIDTVSFNFDNVRVKKYKKAKCKALGVSKLNQELEEHQKAMQDILLNTRAYSNTKAASLKEELAKFGQEDPALISPEGILLNGNRRTAVLRDFYENGFTTSEENGVNVTAGNSDWKSINVCVLRKTNGDALDDNELRSLEKRLQNKPSTREEYGDVNDSIDIRDAFAKTFGTRDYTADVKHGGATDTEKSKLELEFADLKETKVKFEWLCECIEILDLIDDYLKTHRQGDKSGQYNLVEDKTVFKGGLTTFYGLLNYRKKLQALDDGSDPLYVEAHMLQVTTALRSGNLKYEFVRALGTLVTPEVERRRGEAKYGNVDCGSILLKNEVNSPILANPAKYINDPAKLEDQNLQDKELASINSAHFSLERAIEDPKTIIKDIRQTLEDSISDEFIPKNDIEFSENIAAITKKLAELEKKSKE